MKNEGFTTRDAPAAEPARLELRLEEETSGMAKWRVSDPDNASPPFVVSLLGATVSKVEEMLGRKLTEEDLRRGIYRAVSRGREYLERQLNRGEVAPEEVLVMVRDTDLAGIDPSPENPTNDVPT